MGQTPDFVVWTGDNARHDADPQAPRTAQDIYRANSVVASMMASIGVPTVPSIGNNDVYPHDTLCLANNDPNIGNLSVIWKQFIPGAQMATFQTLGSFVAQVRPNVQVVSLNTMAMFKKNKCDSGCHSGEAGEANLKWLETALWLAATQSGQQVYITGHIPPIPDFWHHKCLERYAEITAKYASTIAGHLYAHTHQDNYAILENDDSGLPVAVINIAPSGVASYNPSARQYSYDVNSGLITDYTQYYANITEINALKSIVWRQEYSWKAAYGYNSWSLNNWIDLDQRIQTQPALLAQYLKYRYVSSGATQFTFCSPQMAAAGACILHLDKHHAHP